jgi:hypothetical protein
MMYNNEGNPQIIIDLNNFKDDKGLLYDVNKINKYIKEVVNNLNYNTYKEIIYKEINIKG